jgi:hypothetical protein
MVTTVAPLKGQAQAIIILAIYAVVGVGPGETVEMHWVPKPGQASPLRPAIEPGSMTTFTIVVTNIGSSSNAVDCTQAFSVPVVAQARLNTLSVSIGSGEELVINGQAAGRFLDRCFAVGGTRNTISVGRQIPPDLADRFTADPTSIPAESNRLRLHEIWGYSIVDFNGQTLASVMPSTLDTTPYILRIEGILN